MTPCCCVQTMQPCFAVWGAKGKHMELDRAWYRGQTFAKEMLQILQSLGGSRSQDGTGRKVLSSPGD